jgi:hypothetical protein
MTQAIVKTKNQPSALISQDVAGCLVLLKGGEIAYRYPDGNAVLLPLSAELEARLRPASTSVSVRPIPSSTRPRPRWLIPVVGGSLAIGLGCFMIALNQIDRAHSAEVGRTAAEQKASSEFIKYQADLANKTAEIERLRAAVAPAAAAPAPPTTIVVAPPPAPAAAPAPDTQKQDTKVVICTGLFGC